MEKKEYKTPCSKTVFLGPVDLIAQSPEIEGAGEEIDGEAGAKHRFRTTYSEL